VVDLVKLRIAADRTLPFTVQTIAADDRYVYAGLAADAFLVLDRKDLSDVRRAPTSGQVRYIHSIGDLLFVNTFTGMQVLKWPDLFPAEAADIGIGLRADLRTGKARADVYRVGDG
jgi:hypothetical protein